MIRGAVAAALLAALAIGSPAAAQQLSPAERVEAFAKLPYWPGFWISESAEGTEISGVAPDRPEGAPPVERLNGRDAPWNAEGLARQAEAARTRPGRKAAGWGYPMMMDAATPFQVMITPEETLIVNAYGETRHIYTDGRKLPPAEDMWPTVWGTSVGHWEGDTLVVETVQVQMPYSFFHGAPTFSEQAIYRERLRLDGDKLTMEMTVEDPVTLTEPFRKVINHVRETGYDRMIQMDFANDRTGQEDGVNTIEPPKD
ncbi:hypothetical protein [Tsuneonella sp. HG222]